MNAPLPSAQIMLFALTHQAVMIVDVGLDILVILLRSVQRSQMEPSQMIYVRIRSVVQMRYAIWDNVYVPQDLKEMIHIMLPLGAQQYQSVHTILIVVTMRSVPKFKTVTPDNVSMHVVELHVDLTQIVSPIIITEHAYVTKVFLEIQMTFK